MSNSISIYVLSALYIDVARDNLMPSILSVSLDYESCLKKMSKEINNTGLLLKHFFPIVGFNISTWVNGEKINTQSYTKEGVLNEKN